jgi:hypothetical protein
VETPKERPSMQDVYTEVITIKETFAALRGWVKGLWFQLFTN